MLVLKKFSRPQIKLYSQRGMIVFLVGVLGITLMQPSDVMAIFNFNNPATPQRNNVSPLDSASNNPKAAPSAIGSNIAPLSSTKMDGSGTDRTHVKEIVGKRTSHTKTFLNKDGTSTLEHYAEQQNYKDDGKWLDIDNSLESSEGTDGKERLSGEAGSLSATMKPLHEGIVVKADDRTFTIRPSGAQNANPVQVDDRTAIYKDAWPGVDLQYELRGEAVKEIIVVKNKNAPTKFDFSVSGGDVIKHPSRAGELTIAGLPEDYSFSAVTLDVNGRGVISEERVTQRPTASGIAIEMDDDWFRSQPDSAFPMRIDPTITRQGSISYKMYKSDGFYCTGSSCYANTGSINDNGYKHWRTYINFDYTALTNKTVLNADLYGWYQTGIGGSTTTRSITMGLASCSTGFSCAGSTAGTDSSVSTNFSLDFTAKLKAEVDADDYSNWWSIRGVESSSTLTYKPYYDMKATIVYDTPTPMSVAASPADKATIVSTQPSLRVNTVTDADGDAVKYYFRVATNPDAETGAVINSGWIDSPQWTVPDNILQDGRTYYWHVYTKGYAQKNPTWVRSFKVDMRTGKDSTQAYEELGPVNVDLATGNATTSTGSHSISALGGDIGVSLDYNSPAMSRPGLVGQYWNNTTFTGNPVLTRVDPSIDFSWATGSPSAGVVNVDNFSSRWSGYITAPSTGDYKFGCTVDAQCKIYLDDQLYFNRVSNGTEISTTTKQLVAGQPVKVVVEHMEGTGAAAMQLLVQQGTSPHTLVPASWFDTGARETATKYGLTGRYYKAGTGGTFPTDPNDPNTLLMVRDDTKLNFNWGTGAASPGLPADSFVVRWKGYLTVPETGSYTLGGNADMGIRIKTGTGLFGADQTLLDSWSGSAEDRWGSTVNLTAGQPVPITVEAYEGSGEANFNLLVKDTNSLEQEMPVTWLAPNANVLPNGWELGLGDGGVSYERLHVSSTTAVLSDSTGQKYEYTWKNNNYVAPKDQEAILTRNEDNTHTVLDTDGKTYVFDAEGKLKSVAAPEDDRQPAALKYEYGGDPSRLMKISDGVNEARNGTLHYKSVNDSECDVLSGFDSAPDGMLCAFKTTDGKKTTFQYKAGNLARIALPGDAFEDYGYDSFGRVVSYRDPIVNDAIAYGVREDNTEAASEVTYDGLGRVERIKTPAPTPGANRVESTLDYLANATEMHVVGATEPHGFSRKVAYDELFRTTAETDLANLTTTTEWHPDKDLIHSTVDPTGLKSTTIYNEDDLPVDGYGPAPASWFGTNNVPLPDKINAVPHVKTGYDEGIQGLGVSVYNNTKLLHQPKFVTTGMNDASNAQYILDLTNTDITPTNGLSARATGKLRLGATGTYSFRLWHSGGVRLYVNNTLVVDDWADGNERTSPTATYVNNTANALVPITVEFYKAGSTGTGNGGRLVAKLYQTAPGGSETAQITDKLIPNYGLETSLKAYDNLLGDIESKVEYAEPEYGLVERTILDPGGLHYESVASYEQAGQGFLRQTSSELPGGAKTGYEYYSATDTRDNPCTQATEAHIQAGMMQSKIEPDPDGSGSQTGRKSEVVYDDSGTVVAARYVGESWVCATFDERGRTLQTTIPAVGSESGRTISNNYLVNGNPLIVRTTDASGSITVENDLLGRTIKYTDAKGKVTTNTYDTYSKLVSRMSVVGEESYLYNSLDQLTEYKLDGATFATITYDQYGRVNNVDYPAGVELSTVHRDELQREDGVTYTLADSTEIKDSVYYSTSGNIISGNENGVQKTYTYDSVDRLIGATIGENEYEYGFGAPDASCNGLTNNNPDTPKNGNRTKFAINGQITTYCYDQADRLLNSSDDTISSPEYDNRGNTISLGTNDQKTEFSYDSSERNNSITETLAANTGSNNSSQSLVRKTEYNRDVQGRIIERTISEDNDIKDNSHFIFTGVSDTPDAVMDSNGVITQKYVLLPGDVLVTINPQSTSAGAMTVSVPNLHGDVMGSVNADGTLIGRYITGPFGEVVASSSQPQNTVGDAVWQYVGQHQKLTESAFALTPIQMGARVYLPSLGRFLSVDPVQGGTDNNYVYANDPVNESDLTGTVIDTVADVAGIGYDTSELIKKPSWGNAGMLGWSVAATFLPFVPGSYVGRAGAAAVKGVNATKKTNSTKKIPKQHSASKPKEKAKGGVYIGGTNKKKAYVGQTNNHKRRAAEHHRSGKINKNKPRLKVTIKKKSTRNFVERLLYVILGTKRAPWVENKVSPPRSKNPILRFFGF